MSGDPTALAAFNEPEHVEQLTASFQRELEKLAAAPELARVYGERGRQYALANLTWDVKAQRTIDIYRWVMAGRGRPPAPFAEEHDEAARAA